MVGGGKRTLDDFFHAEKARDARWEVVRQADLRMYLFSGGKGMFFCFYVKKIVPVDMA